MLTLVALSLYAGVSFEHLTNAGERWNNGIWYKLDDAGHIVGPELQPGDPGAVLIGTRQDPPDLLRLSATSVVVSVNDTTMASTDGGRSWHHLTESSGPCTKPSVPAPSWLGGKLWMEVNPVAAYPIGCGPKDAPKGECKPSVNITAPADWPYTDWGLSPSGAPAATMSVGRARGPNTWTGAPAPMRMLCTSCGAGVQLADGSYVYLVTVQFAQSWSQCPGAEPNCNNSVVAYSSTDGLAWKYEAAVGMWDPSQGSQEGPNEVEVVLLKDRKTLWAVMRSDGGDGIPSHRTLPFWSSTSTDGGRSWSKLTLLPDDMLSARPKATVLGNGALLVTAGRPGLDLWVSADGFGKSWERFSMATYHNELVASESLPAEWKFCDEWIPLAENHTFAGDPRLRADDQHDGGPLGGWIITSGYNDIVHLEDDAALVCYDRQGWGSGYYGTGLPFVYGPKGVWPKGRSNPPGCDYDHSTTFCMRVKVEV